MSTLADLLVKVGVDDDGVTKGTKGIEGKFSKTWDSVKKTAAVAGAAIGVAVAAAAVQSLDLEAATDKLAASLGASGPEAERLGKVAGHLYADAFGSSMGEVTEAVGAVKSSVSGLNDQSLESVTGKVLNLASAFDIDVARGAQLAGQVVKSGLAKDVDEGVDLITASLQKVPAAVREDLLDALDEYGPFLTSIGITGDKAFGLLVKGAEKGMFGIDKTGDALKEFTIRATDMSAASKVGFDILGMSQEKMAAKLLKGGAAGEKAFGQIIDGLLGIKDPVKQSQAALALFGTPLEDLSVAEIPDFLASLDTAKGGLGDVAGAADKMGDTLNDNAKTKLTAFKRKAEQALVKGLAKALPAIEKVGSFVKDKMIPPLVDGWKKVQPAVEGFAEFVAGTLVPAIAGLVGWLTKHKDVLLALAIAVGVVLVPAFVAWAVSAGAAAVATIAATLPILAVIAVIALLVLGIIALVKHWDDVWGKVKAIAQAIGDWFTGTFVGFFKSVWEKVSGFFVGGFKKIKDGLASAKDFIVDKFNDLIGFFKKLPGRAARAFSGMFDGIKSAFKSGVNWIIRKWNNFHIPGINTHLPGIGTVGGFSTPNIQLLDVGGTIDSTGLAIVHKGEVVVPAQTSPLPSGFGREPAVVNLHISGTGAFATAFLKEVRDGRVRLAAGGHRVVVAGG